jgi:hypothetical protein
MRNAPRRHAGGVDALLLSVPRQVPSRGLRLRPCCLRPSQATASPAAASIRWLFYLEPTASSVRSRTRLGSILIPGPIVLDTVTVLMYLPFAVEGLARSTSSTTAR